ncbi:hypothetical protein B0H16DRAFT_1408474 [Mycena metata]|uniref:F-box domain-containing protein n=1 Tax=Mycena metata TaxID=1033252 RepID=A0AAD7JZJ8_9AGAR|nr:hypothetical protein B0H16DRAFT_1408474 [Mycena metata]
MLRRSARHKPTDEDPEAGPSEIPKKDARPRKKIKGDAVGPIANESAVAPSEVKTSRKKRGKLRFITEMPLDILFEIFSELLPVDLLHLSRASKALRAILLRKSSIFLWKQAFLNVTDAAPPPLPEDLNEAQYTNLLWGKHCYFCGVFTSHVLWECRVRTCKACAVSPTNLTSLDWNSPNQGLKSISHLCSRSYFWSGRRSLMLLYLTSDLEAVKKRFDELADSTSATQEFSDECQRIKRMKDDHGQRCHSWEHRLKSNRKRELKDVGQNRRAVILEKIEELGWSDELSRDNNKHNFMNLPAVRQNKELTERVWIKIKPELVAWLTEVKKQRLDKDGLRALRTRIDILSALVTEDLQAIPISEIRPSIDDVCTMPKYRAILERPSEAKVVTADFKKLDLPRQIDEWRQSNIKLLLQLLPLGSKKQDKKTLDVRPLELCTTFFRCHSCREPISYPRILSHKCLNKFRDNGEEEKEEEEEEEEEEEIILRAFRAAPWIHGLKGIAFDSEASNIAAMLIKKCGQDPTTLTGAAMDELDARFECVRCVHPREGRLVMKWRIAVHHELEDHYGDALKAGSWKLLDAAEVTAAKREEAQVKKRAPPHLLCSRCNTWATFTQLQMYDHRLSTHPRESFEDITIMHPDVTIQMPPLAVRLSARDE